MKNKITLLLAVIVIISCSVLPSMADELPEGIPDGYHVLSPSDVGMQFGVDIDPVIYFDTDFDFSEFSHTSFCFVQFDTVSNSTGSSVLLDGAGDINFLDTLIYSFPDFLFSSFDTSIFGDNNCFYFSSVSSSIPQFIYIKFLVDNFVSGEWIFDDSFTISSEFAQNVNFISNGIEFSKISVKRYYGFYCLYYDDTIVYDKSGWVDESYKTLDFGINSTNFNSITYSFLTNSATFHSGLRLPTIVQKIQISGANGLMKELIAILPIGLACLVGWIALRKALRTLQEMLQAA